MNLGSIKLKFGKYKGTQLKDVPVEYLNWALDNTSGMLKGKALEFAKSAVGKPMERFKVTVRNSVNSDGEYIVEAYSLKQAVEICQRTYNIKCTQSFDGTEFSVVKL